MRPGWFAEVKEWLEDVLEPHSERVLGLEQVSLYDLACVLRAQTESGSVYLKASVDPLESVVASHLARTFSEPYPGGSGSSRDARLASHARGRGEAERRGGR